MKAKEFSKIWKNILKKIEKGIIFLKSLKPCVNFSLGWMKTANCLEQIENMLKFFDENLMEVLNFNVFLGKLMLKQEHPEITRMIAVRVTSQRSKCHAYLDRVQLCC